MVHQTSDAKEEVIMKKTIIAVMVSVVCMAYTVPASAVYLVYDKANHIENIISAVHAVKQLTELMRHSGMLGSANQNKGMFHNTYGDSVEMNEFLGITKQTENALKQSIKVMNDLQNVYGASQYGDWQTFVKKIGERRESGDKQAQQLYDAAFAADQQVRKSHEANLKILAANKSVSGVTSAVQGVANALSLVIDQNNTMLRSMSTKNQMEAQRMEVESIKKEQEEKEYEKYKNSVKSATERDKAHLQSIGVGVN